jgi:hypothetical protein
MRAPILDCCVVKRRVLRHKAESKLDTQDNAFIHMRLQFGCLLTSRDEVPPDSAHFHNPILTHPSFPRSFQNAVKIDLTPHSDRYRDQSFWMRILARNKAHPRIREC